MNYSKLILFAAAILAVAPSAVAQIGYQVSLLNNASGEPRANESVTVTVTITNSEGGTVCSETKTETTNDFGVLSMTVGSDAVFAAADWSKLPFFISATVDGILIGRSQLLSVPVAECAKTLPSCETIIQSKQWKGSSEDGSYILSFGANNIMEYTYIDSGGSYTRTKPYYVQGNIIVNGSGSTYFYVPEKNYIIGSGDGSPYR